MPGSASRPAASCTRSGSAASARATPTTVRPRARVIGSVSGSTCASTSADGNAWVGPGAPRTARAGERAPVLAHDPPGDGGRRGQRDLLAHHGAHERLEVVGAAGHPQAGPPAHQRAEQRVGSEGPLGRPGVVVEPEQVASHLDRGGRPADHQVVAVDPQRHRPRPAVDGQDAPVGGAVPGLEAGHGVGGEEAERPREVLPAGRSGAVLGHVRSIARAGDVRSGHRA